jgi:hypothetical protein
MTSGAAKRRDIYPNWPEHVRPEDLQKRLPRVYRRHFLR